MRAREFMDEEQRERTRQRKREEMRKKLTDIGSKSNGKVKGMAANALMRRRVGIYGLQQR